MGDNKAGGEVIQCQLKKMQAELIGPDTTPVVRLAAERVLAIWLQVQLLDIRLTDQHASLDHIKFFSGQQDQASRRYAAALKMFATLQRLSVATPSPKPQQRAKGAMPSVNAMRQMVARMATPRTA